MARASVFATGAVMNGALYATARPFSCKFTVTNTENLVYVIQVWNDGSGQWDNATGLMRSPVTLGSTSTVMIDPSQQLSDTLTTSQRVDGGGHKRLVNNLRKARIICTPEYYDNNLLTFEPDLALWDFTHTFYFTDAAPSHKMCANHSEDEYMSKFWIRSSAAVDYYRFATLRPQTIHRCEPSINEGYNDYVSAYVDTNLRCQAIITTESGNVSTETLSQQTGDYGHYSFGVGTKQIKEYLSSGAWNALTSSGTDRIVKIQYYLKHSNGNILTDVMTTLVSNRNCCIEDTHSVELVWKNRIGGNDTFVLKGAVGTQEAHEFELFERRQGYRRRPEEDPNHSSFNPNAYQSTWHQGSTNVAKIGIKAFKKLEVNSQFMSKKTIDWAAELATAPRVYIREDYDDVSRWHGRRLDNDYLQQVYVETTEITTKEKKTGLGQLELDIVYANPIPTQRI